MTIETINKAIKKLMMEGVALGDPKSRFLKVEDEEGIIHNFALTVGTSGSVGIHSAPHENRDTQSN